MPIEKLLSIIRNQLDSQKAWEQVLDLCNAEQASNLWASLPRVDLDRDIAATKAWFDSFLSRTQAPIRVYLGLDTLNMHDGKGSNIEIGWIAGDTNQNGTEWAYGELTYGDPFLISSLASLQNIYSLPQYDNDFSLAEYILFLGYSGLVVREALISYAPNLSMLFAWGFHDGDLFLLGRTENNKLQMLC